jgi:hypothetical protein
MHLFVIIFFRLGNWSAGGRSGSGAAGCGRPLSLRSPLQPGVRTTAGPGHQSCQGGLRKKAGLLIRTGIHLIQIKQLRLNTDQDPDRIQGFDDQKLENNL